MKSIYTKFFSTNALMTLLFLFASTFVFGQNGSSNLSAHANHPEKGKIKLDGKPNSVELVQKRTLNNRVFDNKDGTKTEFASVIPIHYQMNTWAAKSSCSYIPRTDERTIATYLNCK